MKEDTGTDHPALASKPTLRDDCIRYYDAFRSLGVCRLWSQVGPCPIQVSEIKSLLKLMGFKDKQTKLKYLRLIQLMDAVEMNFHAANMKAKQ